MPESTDNGTPVRVVVESEIRLMIKPEPLLRAIGLRQQFDPDEVTPRVFVPRPDEVVLLVKTKAGVPIGNN